MRFSVLTAAMLNIQVFWGVIMCHWVSIPDILMEHWLKSSGNHLPNNNVSHPEKPKTLAQDLYDCKSIIQELVLWSLQETGFQICTMYVSFTFSATKIFMLHTQKHTHTHTIHSVYLQHLNMWQSPSKQNNSQFDVLDHKDKWMVGNKLLWLRHRHAGQRKHSSWEARKTYQILLLLLQTMITSYHLWFILLARSK
jgi:hypothetical protein